MLRLLCITAHPDDEAGAFGGTLLLCQDREVETSVVCLTAGTAARNRGGARSDEELAQMRRAEFAESCRMLGVTNYEVLDYLDGQLERTEVLAVTRDIVRRIRSLRPHVVLTFGPDGGLTAHIDHAMAGMFATMAYQWAGRSDRFPEQLNEGLRPHRAQKLYHLAADFVLPDRAPISPPTVTARIEIGEERFRKKTQAFTLHTTQTPLFDKLKKNLGQGGGTLEMYHLLCTRDPRDAKLETDLFEGVVED